MVPPNPNALTAARRGPDHGSGAVSTRNGVPASASNGRFAPSVAGRTPARSAPSTFSSPATPAEASRCPTFDFTEPMGTSSPVPKTWAMPRASTASPTGVPVAWHSTSDTVSGAMPAESYARRMARTWPSSDGLISPAPRPSLDNPTPRITPSTGRRAVRASDSRIRATNPAPSPCTSPSASWWKGRLRPVRLAADSPQKPTCR
ncbi:hypothetical protein GA0115254_107216 [Streptomyces sp. Ncost-T10-10d]|nr:hypothetical protein GA0115254_107216 [Streptomyces sp. Ncost-T10-10d]